MIHLYDGSYFAHRNFHGMPKLTNSKGKPVGMLVGAASAIHKLAADKKMGPTLFAFDIGKCKWRAKLVPTYKANRVHDPDIGVQMKVLMDIVAAYGIKTWAKAGVEADDVIGTVTRMALEQGARVRIHTGDKDMNQLLKGTKVDIIHPVSGKITTEATLKKEFGFGAARFVDYLALMGDSTDGYPGLPDCGPKTAKALLSAGGSVKAMLADPKTAGKLAKTVKANLETLEANYKVARIRRKIALPFSVDDLTPTKIDTEKLLEIFDKWELNAAAKRVKEIKNRPKGLFG